MEKFILVKNVIVIMVLILFCNKIIFFKESKGDVSENTGVNTGKRKVALLFKQ